MLFQLAWVNLPSSRAARPRTAKLPRQVFGQPGMAQLPMEAVQLVGVFLQVEQLPIVAFGVVFDGLVAIRAHAAIVSDAVCRTDLERGVGHLLESLLVRHSEQNVRTPIARPATSSGGKKSSGSRALERPASGYFGCHVNPLVLPSIATVRLFYAEATGEYDVGRICIA